MKKGLRLHLVAQDLTVRTLAARIGITHQYLYDIFLNKRQGTKVRQRLVAEYGFPAELVRFEPPIERRAA
jgi:hypothetical protein